MSYSVLTSENNVFSGEQDGLWIPKSPRAGKYGVVLCHGAATPDMFAGTTWPHAVALAAAIASAGIPCVAGDFGGDTWANDTAMARVTAAHAYLAGAAGASSARVHIVGCSMGGGIAYRYASLNTGKVASVTGIIPMASISALYNSDNPAGARASIGAAWGVTYPAALPAGADLPTLAAAMKTAGIPNQALYSTVDPYISVSDVQALANAAGGIATAIDSAYGHADGTFSEIDVNALISFLITNGA